MKEKLNIHPKEHNPASSYLSLFSGAVVRREHIISGGPLFEQTLNILLREGIIVGQWGFDLNGKIDLYVFMPMRKNNQEINIDNMDKSLEEESEGLGRLVHEYKK